MTVGEHRAAHALLRWYADAGVDECIDASPSDFYSWQSEPRSGEAPQIETVKRQRLAPEKADNTPLESISTDEAIRSAEKLAASCQTFEALDAAVRAFEGCPLKTGARSTVFTDGVPGSDLLVIGEAPGRDEDRLGKPFVGRAGQLLDKMLAAIDHSREHNTLISNVIYWRPPANRTPTAVETAVCKPFVDRLIEITEPKAVMIAGGAPLQALLGVTGIMRARGVWREIETSSGLRIPALPVFHPAFLLRQPASKRLAWADLQNLAKRLKER
ncbi:uracil-DNA glycosylase [Hyphococcus flavus]|uniref:Type-4 uracil-DNA glycosylase n=1 Tax=Hyphococcus flavus TaxID=1866326 RepID=A0AAF0CCD3_9PROT|nr:uracil-DNA glycosylase [Hyphococcus flavus]WDI33205.1 uracil-DNA glycosylase [Hyphococcus flavus]